MGELEHEPTPVSNSNGGSVQKKLGGRQNQPGPVLNSATSETEVSETEVSETEVSETEVSETEVSEIDVSEIKESESVIEDEEEKESLIGSWKYLSRFSILINRQNTNFKEIFP